MRIPREPRAARETRIDQRRVVQPVLEHTVAASDKRAGDREVRHVASREQQRARPSDELGELPLERMVLVRVSADEVRRAAADAPAARGVDESLDETRVLGET